MERNDGEKYEPAIIKKFNRLIVDSVKQLNELTIKLYYVNNNR